MPSYIKDNTIYTNEYSYEVINYENNNANTIRVGFKLVYTLSENMQDFKWYINAKMYMKIISYEPTTSPIGAIYFPSLVLKIADEFVNTNTGIYAYTDGRIRYDGSETYVDGTTNWILVLEKNYEREWTDPNDTVNQNGVKLFIGTRENNTNYYFEEHLDILLTLQPFSTFYVKVNDNFVRNFTYVKVNNIWKKATSYIKINGEWKRSRDKIILRPSGTTPV